MSAPRHFSLRGVPADLARSLKAEARRRGASLNQTAKDILRRGLNLHADAPEDNGLRALAGTWSDDDLADFERATAFFEEVDDETWA